jgi:hypothetical protein
MAMKCNQFIDGDSIVGSDGHLAMITILSLPVQDLQPLEIKTRHGDQREAQIVDVTKTKGSFCLSLHPAACSPPTFGYPREQGVRPHTAPGRPTACREVERAFRRP